MIPPRLDLVPGFNARELPVTKARLNVLVNVPKSIWPALLAIVTAGYLPAQPAYDAIYDPPHNYNERRPADKFTRLLDDIQSGKIPLDRTNEKAFLLSLLKLLDIPVSSQTLVFSTTSLQLSLISAANPRAIYFNEEVYIGYIPGGKIEIVALDPTMGAIFYLMDVPNLGAAMNIERAKRCMNCHAGDETGHVPGLVIKSVIPGPNGGSLDAYRIAQSGHGIPFTERFGGWYVTGEHGITNHLGNFTGKLAAGQMTLIPNPPEQRFRADKYPVATSDILPHLLHEHQMGFVNRAIEATYRARTIEYVSGGKLNAEQTRELNEQARILTRYLLFADEVVLPPGGVIGDADYRKAFLHNRRATANDRSLKDFDLLTRLFKYRCSYMIYSPVFEGLPLLLKQRVFARMNAALNGKESEFAYLPSAERQAIREILRATLPELAAD
jgi:hypothetical protein